VLCFPYDELEAPGILGNPVPVEALYDREAARRVIFRNLLQRQGYASLEDVRAEGEIQGLRKAIVAVLVGRGLAVDGDLRTALAGSGDPAVLESALRQAATASFDGILAALRA
jgi:hypothetical protein